MDESAVPPSILTEGILIGHELGEWAGFKSGRLVVKKNDGMRIEFRFGKESRGKVPRIGSLVTIEHTSGYLPEIFTIECVTKKEISLYKDGAETFASSLFLGRSTGVNLLVLTEVITGIVVIMLGLLSGQTEQSAPLIFGLCGAPHIIIGYLIWYYSGE